MTLLTTWPETGPQTVLRRTTVPAAIAAALTPLGVRFERWPVHDDVPVTAGSEQILAAYHAEIDTLTTQEGFTTVDAVALHPSDTPDWPQRAKKARETFLNEHTHDDDDEVRYFTAGAGVFYLHIAGHVHAVYCARGDLLAVPKGTKHWFDMGTRPAFTAIRFFHEKDGWIATFTGSDIACRFPDFDAIQAGLPPEPPA
ncbi:1,2-dihydroxy-3-keto-5-methylthiopentene dioxygenase [Streptomyces sp. V4I8]|uniref:1,2-dihydroxy-3-keto-5-methylthiopentene dioxygenase n=1 Tax=Streptomyces sp. V4I8 TaxID=3156469 RepID=UPI003512AAAC